MIESPDGEVPRAVRATRTRSGPAGDLARVVVIGASAGGIQALIQLVRALPADLAAAVLVVVHIPSDAPSRLPDILDRSGPLPAAHALDGEPLADARIFVAPPGRHMTVSGGRVELVDGPPEHRVRPAVDPLFRSAAREYGNRTIGVILSGQLDDGTAGLAAIAAAGGTTVIQDPADAIAAGMPMTAQSHVRIDHQAGARALGPLLAHLVAEPLR